MPWTCRPAYSNFLLYVSLSGAAAISIGSPRAVFDRIPWDSLYERLFGSQSAHFANPPPIIHLCNSEDSNCFEPILWLHAALTATRPVDVLRTLLSVYKADEPRGLNTSPVIVGMAMYELHAIDSIIPSSPQELDHALKERHTERTAILENPDSVTFELPTVRAAVTLPPGDSR